MDNAVFDGVLVQEHIEVDTFSSHVDYERGIGYHEWNFWFHKVVHIVIDVFHNLHTSQYGWVKGHMQGS